MEELPDSVTRIWRFVLERGVHEFNNRVGGILSVSETHLSRQIDDAELRQSLALIRDSAQAASEFVATTVDLLAAEEATPDLIQLSDLREYLHTKLKLFLPRHIRLSTPPCSADIMVRANGKLLLFDLLALLQNELEEQPASFSLELALKVEGTSGWLIYRATGRTGRVQTESGKILLSRMKPAAARIEVQETPDELEVAIGFAAVKGERARGESEPQMDDDVRR